MVPRLIAFIAACLLSGCGSMLPRGSSDTPSPFRIERQTNPLGPFQPAGESAGSLLLR